MSSGVINRRGPVAIAAIHLRADLRCTWCAIRTKIGKRHVDHVIPLRDGGTDDTENLVLACEACNCGRAGCEFLPDRAVWAGRTVAVVRAEIERQIAIPIGPGSDIYPRALRQARLWWPRQFERRAAARAAWNERQCGEFFDGVAA
jgi:hypothetical protein